MNDREDLIEAVNDEFLDASPKVHVVCFVIVFIFWNLLFYEIGKQAIEEKVLCNKRSSMIYLIPGYYLGCGRTKWEF